MQSFQGSAFNCHRERLCTYQEPGRDYLALCESRGDGSIPRIKYRDGENRADESSAKNTGAMPISWLML